MNGKVNFLLTQKVGTVSDCAYTAKIKFSPVGRRTEIHRRMMTFTEYGNKFL